MEIDIKSVASPPEMDDALDYVVETETRRYGFQTPERGELVLTSVTRPATDEDDTTATLVTDESFDGTLPTAVQEALLQYFEENFGDEMTIRVEV